MESPPGKRGSTSIPQVRGELPREACAVRADAKPLSSTKDRICGVTGGLAISTFRGNFTGFREICLYPLLVKSSRSNWHVLHTPLFYSIGNSHPWPWWCFTCATMIPLLIRILCKALAQDSPIPTSTQVTHNLALARCFHMAPRSIYRT